jgi:hypothetical protein
MFLISSELLLVAVEEKKEEDKDDKGETEMKILSFTK